MKVAIDSRTLKKRTHREIGYDSIKIKKKPCGKSIWRERFFETHLTSPCAIIDIAISEIRLRPWTVLTRIRVHNCRSTTMCCDRVHRSAEILTYSVHAQSHTQWRDEIARFRRFSAVQIKFLRHSVRSAKLLSREIRRVRWPKESPLRMRIAVLQPSRIEFVVSTTRLTEWNELPRRCTEERKNYVFVTYNVWS